MPNAEYDTPTSGDLNEGDAEGRRILEGLREHLREVGSLAGSFERRSRALGGAPLRRFVAEACREFRGLHDVEGDLIRLGEKFSTGFDAITIRDLRAAPSARAGRWQRLGVAVTRAIAIAGAGVFTAAEAGVLPPWTRPIGFLVGLAGGCAMPSLMKLEK